MKKILVISAHPDDETLGVGGTILKEKDNGNIVEVLILTDGVTARSPHIEKQKEAAERACNILNVDKLHFSNLPDQRLDELALIDVIKPISLIVNDLKPDIVFTHHGGDVNQDHRCVFQASIVSMRPVGDNKVSKLFSYEVPSSTEWAPPFPHYQFIPNYFSDIYDYLPGKLKALNEYTKTHQSEILDYPHPRSFKAVEIRAKQRGITVGLQAAESFMLIRGIN